MVCHASLVRRRTSATAAPFSIVGAASPLARSSRAARSQQRRRAAERNEARRLLDLLTPREFEVMQLVIRGMLNKQVGGELGVAEKTVKVHRGRLMQKLGVTSVAELVQLVQKAEVRPPARSETKV